MPCCFPPGWAGIRHNRRRRRRRAVAFIWTTTLDLFRSLSSLTAGIVKAALRRAVPTFTSTNRMPQGPPGRILITRPAQRFLALLLTPTPVGSRRVTADGGISSSRPSPGRRDVGSQGRELERAATWASTQAPGTLTNRGSPRMGLVEISHGHLVLESGLPSIRRRARRRPSAVSRLPPPPRPPTTLRTNLHPSLSSLVRMSRRALPGSIPRARAAARRFPVRPTLRRRGINL